MKTLKGSTKAGQRVISMYKPNIGDSLYDVYQSHSSAKERAYQWCRNAYFSDEHHAPDSWHICSANTFAFTCGWMGVNDKEGGCYIRLETTSNSYLVWLEK